MPAMENGYCKIRYMHYQTLYCYPLLWYSGLPNECAGTDNKLGKSRNPKIKKRISKFLSRFLFVLVLTLTNEKNAEKIELP